MAIRIDTHAAIRELEAAGADAKLAEAIVATISRAGAGIATNPHVEAIVQIILAQLLIAGVVVAFPKLTA